MAYLAIYKNDWRKLKKSRHVRLDRERANRLRLIKSKEEILFAIYELRKRKVNLYMTNGMTLVVGLKDNRDEDFIITIIPGSRWRAIYIFPHIRRFDINFQSPVVVID